MKNIFTSLGTYLLLLVSVCSSPLGSQAVAGVAGGSSASIAFQDTTGTQKGSLRRALDELAAEGGIRFSYRTEDLEGIRIKSRDVTALSVEDHLLRWLEDTGLTFTRINDRHYVIVREASVVPPGQPRGTEVQEINRERISVISSGAATVSGGEGHPVTVLRRGSGVFTVSGTVTDPDGLTLIGATVREQGTTTGTVTDVNGEFSLSVSSGEASLSISYTGYETLLVPVNNRSVIRRIELREDIEELQEVVVIAYGEAKAADVVGSVDQVSAKKIEGLQNNSFETALKGQVAGVQVRTGSGRPDGGSELLVRGVGTSGNNAPLIVIDGVPFGNENTQGNNLLALLNPEDIESVSVIRDASGKSLYGSRAGNGLILITTKRGRPGKPTINVGVSSGVQVIPDFEKPDVLNAAELARFRFEREIDNGIEPDAVQSQFQDPDRYGEGTDWWDLITRTGTRRNADISVRGGSEKATYSISAGYTGNEGVIKNTAFERYSFRASFTSEITDWLKFDASISPTQTESNDPGTDPGTGAFQAYHILQVARWADPSAPAFNPDGSLTEITQGDLLGFWQANPLYRLENVKNTRVNRRIQGQINVRAEVLPGLQVKQLLAGNLFSNRNRFFQPGSVVGRGLTPANPDPQANTRASAGRYENSRLLSETTLNFKRTYGRHSIDALAGYISELNKEIFLNVNGSRLINEEFELFNSGNIARFLETDPDETRIFFGGSEGESEQALLSQIGRLQYNFDEKYYLTGSIRRDASSRFGSANRAAYFPAVAAAWRLTKEPWFPKGKVLTNARLEVSLGQTGNNRIGNYQYQGTVGRNDYVFGRGDAQAQAQGFAINSLPNALLAWEQIDQLDVGLELGFYKKRLNLEITYYEQTTNDLLNTSPLPRISGFGGIVSNVGTIENKGLEIQLRSKPVVKDDFVWTVDGNISFNRNKVIQLGCCNVPIRRTGAANGTTISYTVVGEPVAQYYGLNILGLYTPEMLADPTVPRYPGAVPGSLFYEDGDGDGLLESQEDYVFLGNPLPDFNYGITTFLTYKDISLRIVGNGEQGSLIYDLSREIELNTSDDFNVRREVLDRYRPGSDDFSLRVPTTETVESSRRLRFPNSLMIQNGSFFQISNITLSYKLNRLLRNVNGIKGATLSLTAQNPFVFSPFRGNPETGRGPNSFERSINYNTYPSVRTFVVGLNASL